MAVVIAGIEGEAALRGGNNVVVRPDARGRGGTGAGAPVRHHLVAPENPPILRRHAGFAAHGRLPQADVVAQVAVQRPRTREAVRQQAVVGKDPRIEAHGQFDETAGEPVAGHVAAHVVRAVGQTVGEAAVGGQKKKMRAPAVTGGQNEGSGAEFDGLVGGVLMKARGGLDAVRARCEVQRADQRMVVKADAPRSEQPVEGPIRGVLGARRAHRAGVAALAHVASLPRLGVACPGLRPEGDPRRVGPLPHAQQVVRERQRRHRIRLGARVAVGRPLFAGDAQPLLRFLVEWLEVVEGDGPIVPDPVQGTHPEILRRVPGHGTPPVHRGAPQNHRLVHLALAGLAGDVVVRVGVLAVCEHARPGRGPLLQRDRAPPRLDYRNGGLGAFRETFGDHGRADPASDDADVALDDLAHDATPGSRAGSSPAPARPLHCCMAMARP